MEGGVEALNNKVMALMRSWVTDSARALIATIPALLNYGTGKLGLSYDQLSTLHNTAVLLTRQSKFEEKRAENIYEKSVKGHEELFGRDHYLCVTPMMNLGSCLGDIGDFWDRSKDVLELE